MKRYTPYIASLLAGWIAAFAMPPVGFWPCILIGFSLLFYYWHQTTTYKSAFFTAFLFGIGYFTTGLWWIGNALLVEGNEFWWVWPVSVIGLPTLLSFFTGLFAAIAKVFYKDVRLSSWIGFSALITLSEWVRGTIMTGFPWNLYGYAWNKDLALMQSVSLFGAYTLTLITVLIATLPAVLWLLRPDKRRMMTAAIASTCIALMLYGFGSWRLNQGVQLNEDIVVRVVQANIHQTLKWDPSQTIPNFEKHLALSSKEKIPQKLFILWPETAIPPVLLDNDIARDKIETMLSAQSAQGAYLLSGALVHRNDEKGERYYNAMLAFDKHAAVRASYAKTHLVPFGEFIPFQQWIPIKPVVRFQGFERGDGPTTYAIDDMPSFSPLVCYEIIFPGRTVDTHNRPAFLAAVTNDGWYGDSAGPRQHFFQVTVRAIEEGLPAIRSANTGISGVVDSYGRVLAKSELFQETSIDHALPSALPPTLYAQTGNGLWYGLLILVIICTIVRTRFAR